MQAELVENLVYFLGCCYVDLHIVRRNAISVDKVVQDFFYNFDAPHHTEIPTLATVIL